MIAVEQLLKSKGSNVWFVAPDDTIYNALTLMNDKQVGALPVVKEGKLVGIISERDYARKVILKGKSSLNTAVSEIMTSHVVCVTLNQKLSDCMNLMTDKRIRHLPVLDNDKMVGIISIGDVLKEIISEQKTFIEDLQNYIEGSGYGR